MPQEPGDRQEPAEQAAISGADRVSGAPGAPGRQIQRRRRANADGGRKTVHRVKVTPEEEALLVQLAERHRVTVPRLLMEAALSARGETPTQRRDAIAELFAVRRLLAGIATNVNQLARHANAGEEFPDGAAASLAAVRRIVVRLDQAIDELASPS